MFIYLFIAAELALLYVVFWYVFVRDPKPFKITGDPWGTYGESPKNDASQSGDSDRTEGCGPELSGVWRVKSDPKNGWVVANFGRPKDRFQS